MLIDTHCHLDAAEFDGERVAVLDEARRVGVGAFLVPAIGVGNFDAVAALSAVPDEMLEALADDEGLALVPGERRVDLVKRLLEHRPPRPERLARRSPSPLPRHRKRRRRSRETPRGFA